MTPSENMPHARRGSPPSLSGGGEEETQEEALGGEPQFLLQDHEVARIPFSQAQEVVLCGACKLSSVS